MATHYFSNAFQAKKKSAKNGDSTSQEEIQKTQRRRMQMELRKERRSLEIERHRHLTTLDYSVFDANEDINIPIESIACELKNQYDNRAMIGAGDVVDGAVSRSNGSLGNHNDSVLNCLRLIQNKLKQENNGSITPPIPDMNVKLTANSPLVECLVHSSQFSTFETIVSLLKQELINSSQSNKHLLIEIVDTIYLTTKMANSEQLQSMAKTFVHEPLSSILYAKSDVVLCTKTFFCLSFIASNCKDLRIFLIQNGFTAVILKHSHYALSVTQNDEDNTVNYIRSIAYTVRVFTSENRENISDSQFASDVIESLKNLMQLNDEMVKANVYWSFSELTVPSVIDYIQKLNLIPNLIDALDPHKHGYKYDYVREAAIACLASITARGDMIANAVINCNFIQYDIIEALIHSNSSVVQHETVVTLINLVNANPSVIVNLTKGGIIGPVLELLYWGEYKSQKQVTNLLRSIVLKGSSEDALELLNRNVISSLSTQLTVTEPDFILTTLEIYEQLLEMEKKRVIHFDVAEKCEQLGVIDKMENLVSYPNQVITDTCYRIYDNYIAPQDSNSLDSMQSNTFNF